MLELIEDKRALPSIKDEWNTIADRFGHPLLRHEWFSSCVDAFGDVQPLSIFVLRSHGRICAIAPLTAIRRSGATQFHMLDHRLGEPAGLLYENEDALRRLLRGILRFGRPLRLYKLPADSLEARFISSQQRWRYRCMTRPASTSAWVPLSPDRPAFEAALSSRSRNFLRRKWKRAESRGPVSFEAVTPSEDSVEEALRELFRIEASGWKGRQGTAVLSNRRAERFFLTYGRHMARLGALRVFFLRSGGETLAARMAVELAGRMWDLKLAYNEQWRDCSPGILLTHEMLCWAGARGLAAHEFLGTTEDWERMWPIHERPYTSLRTYPLSFAGAFSFAHDLGRFAAQRLRAVRAGGEGIEYVR